MNWKQTTIARILIIIAKMLADSDRVLSEELQHLSNHLNCKLRNEPET